GDCIGAAPFLLRRIHLEGAGKIDAAIAWYHWWHRRCLVRWFSARMGFARCEMGRYFCYPSWDTVVRRNTKRPGQTRTVGSDSCRSSDERPGPRYLRYRTPGGWPAG